MRSRVRRLLGASTLAFFVGLGATGCSGDQQDDEGLEVSENQEANDAGEANAAGDNTAGSNNTASEDNAASEEGGGEATAAEGGGSGTENDLQEIITEMNGQDQKGGNGAPAGGQATEAQALQQESAGGQAAPANQAPVNAAASAAPQAAGGQAHAAAPQSAVPFQPGGTPAAAGLPELGSKMAYIVEKGDTLARISQKIYGNGNRWQEMATLSGLSNPSRIFPGDLVYYTLDESAVAFAKTYESLARSEEQVKPGDTLATIAKRVYGSSTAWRSIWRHNDSIDNPDVVTPGTTVYYLPKGSLHAAIQKVKAAQSLSAHLQPAKTVSELAVKTTHAQSKTSSSGKAAFSYASTQPALGHGFHNVGSENTNS